MAGRARVLVGLAAVVWVLAGCGGSGDDAEFLARLGSPTGERAQRAIAAAGELCDRLGGGQNIFAAGLAVLGEYPETSSYGNFAEAALDVYCPQYMSQLEGLRNSVGGAAPSAPPVVLSFGQQHVFRSGLAVSITAEQCAEPTGNTDPLSGPVGAMVAVQVTVTNNTGQVVDPNMLVVGRSSDNMSLDYWAMSAGDACPLDSPTELFPGESVTFASNAEVPDMRGNLRIEVSDPTASSAARSVYFEGLLSEMAFTTPDTGSTDSDAETPSNSGSNGSGSNGSGSSTSDDDVCPPGEVRYLLAADNCATPEQKRQIQEAESNAGANEDVDGDGVANKNDEVYGPGSENYDYDAAPDDPDGDGVPENTSGYKQYQYFCDPNSEGYDPAVC